MKEPSHKADEIANAVIGASIEVHRILGPGYLEAVYEEALALELAARGLSFKRQSAVTISYKGKEIGKARLDLIVGEQVIVEIKAVDTLAQVHRAQLLSYLRATGMELGLLINFNPAALRDGVRRVVNTAK